MTALFIIYKQPHTLLLKSATFYSGSPSFSPLHPYTHEVGHWCHLAQYPMWPKLTWISGGRETQLQQRAACPGPTISNLSQASSEGWGMWDGACLRVHKSGIVWLYLEGRDQGKHQVKCITAAVTLMQTDCCQSSETWFMSKADTHVYTWINAEALVPATTQLSSACVLVAFHKIKSVLRKLQRSEAT